MEAELVQWHISQYPTPTSITELQLHSLCLPPVTGTVDIGHLPHPVLMHLRTFFDLWDSFTLQAVQSGQPYISDHIMFEVRTSAAATITATTSITTTTTVIATATITATNIDSGYYYYYCCFYYCYCYYCC